VIRVANKHHGEKDGIYIGRPSPLGNPFVLGNYERSDSVARYEKWLRERIAAGDTKVRAALNEIWREAKTGDVTLLCFCSPLACHGDVIKRVVEEHL
jgi:hypothetical protein